MSKLWSKGYELDTLIEDFTVGTDYILDQKLVVFDCLASMAHAKMLHKIGILTQEECLSLCKGLTEIIELHRESQFVINKKDEDCHTAIEQHLTRELGEVGKKIHAARSRNDQVLTALRLYTKVQILEVLQATTRLAQSLSIFATKHAQVPIPGRTHMQLAMPSSLGLWAGAFAESLIDDISLLQNAYSIIDQCPLGSASSYGVGLNIDRQYVADLLGFAKVQNNVLYCNNSRGKFEAMVLHGLAQIMGDLSKLSSDIILFSLPEFKYLSLPKELCSGSSLMPQKKNPCGLELIRAKSATVSSHLLQVLEIIRPLISGYNRDFQETKAPLMGGFDICLSSLLVMTKTIDGLEVHPESCIQAFTGELFATDIALQLVEEGLPFRSAYQQVASQIDDINGLDPVRNILEKQHLGATGNLQLHMVNQTCAKQQTWVQIKQQDWQLTVKELMQ